LFGTGVTKTHALEALVIAGFVRGLSTRDVEATLVDALGEDAAVSKSTVSRVCEAIKQELEAWSRRRLDDVDLDYLFLDGSHFKYHANAAAEPVLAAWGISTDGKPVFVGLDAANSESGDAWAGFLTDLGERGLACPLLVVSDGAPGLIGAVERTMGAALRQRCLIHRARNILPKVPKNAQADVKADYWAIFDVPDQVQPGPKRSPTCRPASTPSPAGGATLIRRRCAAYSTIVTRSPCTCASPASTGRASATPTSSNAPSVRRADGSRSSAGCPANTPACPRCGRC
jgi:putative transposase